MKSFFMQKVVARVMNFFSPTDMPDMVYGSGIAAQIVKKCAILQAPYYPWRVGANFQLLFYLIYCYVQKFFRVVKWTPEICVLEDGQKIIIGWANNDSEFADSGLLTSDKTTPIIIIQHGLMCDDEFLPSQDWIKEAHRRGWLICCQLRRGTKMKLTIPKISFFGSTADIDYLLQNYILKRRPNAKIFLLGLSAGCSSIVRFLGEKGADSRITAAVGISAGYDISTCLRKMNFIYNLYFLFRAKCYFLLERFKSFQGFSVCKNARNLQDFLDNMYEMEGYDSREEYYQKNNPLYVAKYIKTPLLMINSKDDPICVYDNVMENLHLFKNSNSMILATTKTGSHCVFWEGLTTKSWAERAVFEFFEVCLVIR